MYEETLEFCSVLVRTSHNPLLEDLFVSSFRAWE